MARGGINEYQDPQTRRLIDSLIQQANKANNSSTLGGLASVLNQGMAGYRMGQDKRQRGAVNQVVAEEMAKKFRPEVKSRAAELMGTVDDVSLAADPDEYSEELINKLASAPGTGAPGTMEEMDAADILEREMNVADPFVNLSETQIDPDKLGGRTDLPSNQVFPIRDKVDAQAGYDPHRSLMNRLVAMGGDNLYASRMGAQMGMQQAGADRDARIAARVRDEKRAYDASVLKGTQAYDLKKLEGKRAYDRDEFNRQQIKKEDLRQVIAGEKKAEWDRQKAVLKTPEQLAQDVEVAKARAGARPLTEGESKSGGFALRMEGANAVIEKLEGEGYDPTNVQDSVANMSPDVFSSFMRTDRGQLYQQAQQDWVTANLRKESGAAIGIPEMAKDVSKFFPMPGNSKALVKQKARARARAFAGMKASSGKAFGQMKATMSETGWRIVK